MLQTLRNYIGSPAQSTENFVINRQAEKDYFVLLCFAEIINC